METTIDTDAVDRVLDPLVQCFTPDVARRIADLRADSKLQHHIDELAAKANEGRLSDAERREYAGYVEALDIIGILQAKARSVLTPSDSNG
jgi:hypothetical protein